MYVTDTSLSNILRMGLSVQSAQVNLYDRFKVGQILRGAVTAITDDEHVELMLNGHKLLGQTGLNLKPGDALTLKVMNTDEGVLLQLLAPEISQDEASNSAQAFLRMVGLPIDKLNIQMVLLLASHRTEVNKKEVETLRELYDELVGSTEEEPDDNKLNALIFLHKHDLPLSHQTLALALRYLNRNPNFADHLDKFSELLNSSGLPEGWKERLQEFISKATQSGNRALDNVSMLGMFLENQLARDSYNPDVVTLKTFLLEILDWLNSKIGSEFSDAKRAQLQYHAAELLHSIEYDQILNTSPQNKELIWLHLPVLLEGQWHTVQLKLQRRNAEGGGVSPQHYQFGLTVDMSHLGNVSVEGIVVQNGAQCTFSVRDEYSARICEDHLEELSKALDNQGVSLHQAKVIVSSQQNGESFFDSTLHSFHKVVDVKI